MENTPITEPSTYDYWSTFINSDAAVMAAAGMIGAVIIAVIFIIVFRKPISDWIDRITGIGKEGVASPPLSQQSSDEPAELSNIENEMAVFQSEVLTQTEKYFTEEIAKLNHQDKQETIDLLIKYLAHTFINYSYEQNNYFIFGSQIKLLKYLNTQYVKVDFETVNIIYQEAKEQYPKTYSNYSCEQWLNYLKYRTLIIGDDKEGYGITVRGKDYLIYRIRMGQADGEVN